MVGGGQFDVNSMPFLKSISDKSLYTYKKEAILPTGSAPNWATIFMGVGPDVHGYTEWDSKMPTIEYDFEIYNNIYPTIFQKLRLSKPDSQIGMFCQWDGINYLVDTLSCNYHGCYPIKKYSHDTFTNYVIDYIKTSKPNLCAIVFDDPDATGHKDGFYSIAYNKTLGNLDSCISRIFTGIREAGFLESTVFVVTSDHGGINNTHGGESPEEIMTPLFIFGDPIEKYGEINSHLSQKDLMPLMLDLLGVENETHSKIVFN